MSWSDLPLEKFEKIADCLGNRYMEFMDNAALDEVSETDSYGTPEKEGEMAIRELLHRLEKMRAERDEARRMYCEEAFCHRFNERRFNERGGIGPITDPQEIAHMMKWDCFKENTDD